MFDLNEKIHEIRQQPEHIRLRWVWGLLAGAMLVIGLVWILSLQINFQKGPAQSDASVKDITDAINESLEDNGEASIDELLEEGKDTLEDTAAVKDAFSDTEGGVSLDSILTEEPRDIELEPITTR